MKRIITLLTGVVIAGNAFACDFCGCFMGITPYDNQSNIALIYRYKMYSGYSGMQQNHYMFHKDYVSSSPNSILVHPGNYNNLKHGSPGADESAPRQYLQSDYELYTAAELRAKVFVHPRTELGLIVPFLINESRTGDEIQQVKSAGDVTLMIAYHLLEKTLTEKTQHRLIAGYGIKLPTGNFDMTAEDGDRIDFLLQPGTGSLDHLFYLNYIIAGKKLGASLNTAYKLNGPNHNGERVSNSSTSYLNVFYKFRQAKQLKIFPSVQLYHEYCGGVYDNGVYEPGTTMNDLTGGVGLDIFYKQLALNASWHLPVWEQQFDGNLTQAGKFMIGITFSFNQKKYLFNSKKES
ncbi:MAG: hypothetical protein ACJ77K_00050 [Bacteroidia bacterium]